MNGTIAITDYGWYELLLAHPELQEVNFWTPSPRRSFNAEPFSPFFFKLKAPHRAIYGFAFFAQWSALPDWLAWETFRIGNGCRSLQEMRDRIQEIRARIRFETTGSLNEIGCIQLVQPTFFKPDEWIEQPNDWHVRIVTYKRYDLSSGEGSRIWQECLARRPLTETAISANSRDVGQGDNPRYGRPQVILPRLGQGTFRIAVTEAYERACAVTGEHSLPALDAAHIKPFASDGPHDVTNGLLLRADIHRLFDSGYVTITPNLQLEVSSRLREDYQNGRSYYPLHGSPIRIPVLSHLSPSQEFLRWHNENKFLR